MYITVSGQGLSPTNLQGAGGRTNLQGAIANQPPIALRVGLQPGTVEAKIKLNSDIMVEKK